MTSTFRPAETFPPSEFLREELEERGWTEVEFAQILDRPPQLVSEILNDRKEITPETALELGHALGTSAELWLNLQAAHRLSQARSMADLSPVQRRARLRGLVPVRELRNRGWIPDTDNLEDLEESVYAFLGIEHLDEAPFRAVAARHSNGEESLSPEQTAWVAKTRNTAAALQVPEFDIARTERLASEIPRRLSDPLETSKLAEWLADCGVCFVVEFPLRSSKIDGAAFWVDNMPVVALSTRGNRFDGFVFTLLHELAHLTCGHIPADNVKVDEELGLLDTDEEIETEANQRAANWIFPGGLEIDTPVTAPRIVDAAMRYEVHPSLVIGRLQWDGHLAWNQYRGRIPRVRSLLESGHPA